MYALENKILNSTPDTAWYNFGFWHNATHTYEQACENLADKLAEAVQMQTARSVFDIGAGCGDQQLLWQRKYKLHHIHAINTSTAQNDFAQTRIAAAGLSDTITFELASLDSHNARETFDCVVSLDAAYHIPKPLLYTASARLTDANGRLAFTDLALDVG